MSKSSNVQAHTDKYTLVAAVDPDTGEIKPAELGDDNITGLHMLQWVWDSDTLEWVKMVQPAELSDDIYVSVDDLEQYTLDQLLQYQLDDFDTANDPIFYLGYQDKDGNYFIKRINTTTGAVDYTAGSSGYSTAWTNRATESYADFASTF